LLETPASAADATEPHVAPSGAESNTGAGAPDGLAACVWVLQQMAGLTKGAAGSQGGTSSTGSLSSWLASILVSRSPQAINMARVCLQTQFEAQHINKSMQEVGGTSCCYIYTELQPVTTVIQQQATANDLFCVTRASYAEHLPRHPLAQRHHN
jgi:hypothetical protein